MLLRCELESKLRIITKMLYFKSIKIPISLLYIQLTVFVDKQENIIPIIKRGEGAFHTEGPETNSVKLFAKY